MKSIDKIFKSPEYKAISEYLKKSNRWDLADKLIDLVSISYNLGQGIILEIYHPLLKKK